ncbi:hypothetical protein M8J76_008178 [Diaphorina citri]|nr:hypothetical protein M8J75_001586 [Diaphorina citri]KAI5740885.1 hypothetical protein M8J76_008178 [Diaphorina citri]
MGFLVGYIAEVAAAASLENKDKGAYDGRSSLSYDETPYDTKSKQMISTIDEDFSPYIMIIFREIHGIYIVCEHKFNFLDTVVWTVRWFCWKLKVTVCTQTFCPSAVSNTTCLASSAPHLKQKRQKRDDYENSRASDAREAPLYHPFPNESVLQLYGTLA